MSTPDREKQMGEGEGIGPEIMRGFGTQITEEGMAVFAGETGTEPLVQRVTETDEQIARDIQQKVYKYFRHILKKSEEESRRYAGLG